MLASVGDQYQGDAEFESFYAELHRRKAVVFIHPNVPPGYTVPKLTFPAPLIDFIFDTTRAVTNLIYSGTLEKYPSISFILSMLVGQSRISRGGSRCSLACSRDWETKPRKEQSHT